MLNYSDPDRLRYPLFSQSRPAANGNVSNMSNITNNGDGNNDNENLNRANNNSNSDSSNNSSSDSNENNNSSNDNNNYNTDNNNNNNNNSGNGRSKKKKNKNKNKHKNNGMSNNSNTHSGIHLQRRDSDQTAISQYDVVINAPEDVMGFFDSVGINMSPTSQHHKTNKTMSTSPTPVETEIDDDASLIERFPMASPTTGTITQTQTDGGGGNIPLNHSHSNSSTVTSMNSMNNNNNSNSNKRVKFNLHSRPSTRDKTDLATIVAGDSDMAKSLSLSQTLAAYDGTPQSSTSDAMRVINGRHAFQTVTATMMLAQHNMSHIHYITPAATVSKSVTGHLPNEANNNNNSNNSKKNKSRLNEKIRNLPRIEINDKNMDINSINNTSNRTSGSGSVESKESVENTESKDNSVSESKENTRQIVRKRTGSKKHLKPAKRIVLSPITHKKSRSNPNRQPQSGNSSDADGDSNENINSPTDQDESTSGDEFQAVSYVSNIRRRKAAAAIAVREMQQELREKNLANTILAVSGNGNGNGGHAHTHGNRNRNGSGPASVHLNSANSTNVNTPNTLTNKNSNSDVGFHELNALNESEMSDFEVSPKNTVTNTTNGGLNVISTVTTVTTKLSKKAKGYINSANNETASQFSDITHFTGYVSTIDQLEYQVHDALISIIGIGKYDGLPNLDGVIKDYQNVVKTFSRHWKYNLLFQLSNNKYVYTNDVKQLKLKENKHYKLEWNGDEIDDFVELTRKHIVQNKHDALIFVISSHGDREKVMYDSECEIYELDALCSMYQPMGSYLIESYSETKEESNYLSQIPKIFVFDMCRGDMSAKPIKTKKMGKEKKENKAKDKTDKFKIASPIQVDNNDNYNNNNNNEKIVLKGITKEDAQLIATEASNFCKIWGTTEGNVTGDGNAKGGLFLRNFCKLFRDKEFVSNHYLNDIILKIREYTKREATITSDALPFTQMVESEGTLEKNIKFFMKMAHFGFNNNFKNNYILYKEVTRKLLITNLSQSCCIAALIEYEDSSEIRQEMLNNLANDSSNDNSLFARYNFTMIKANGDKHEFDKPYSDRVFITLFVIGDNESKEEDGGYNREIYDRFESKEDYLYFDNDALSRLCDLRLKCLDNAKHNLIQTRIRIGGNINNDYKCKKCGRIVIDQGNDYSFVCRKCKYQLCQTCCHEVVLVKHTRVQSYSVSPKSSLSAMQQMKLTRVSKSKNKEKGNGNKNKKSKKQKDKNSSENKKKGGKSKGKQSKKNQKNKKSETESYENTGIIGTLQDIVEKGIANMSADDIAAAMQPTPIEPDMPRRESALGGKNNRFVVRFETRNRQPTTPSDKTDTIHLSNQNGPLHNRLLHLSRSLTNTETQRMQYGQYSPYYQRQNQNASSHDTRSIPQPVTQPVQATAQTQFAQHEAIMRSMNGPFADQNVSGTGHQRQQRTHHQQQQQSGNYYSPPQRQQLLQTPSPPPSPIMPQHMSQFSPVSPMRSHPSPKQHQQHQQHLQQVHNGMIYHHTSQYTQHQHQQQGRNDMNGGLLAKDQMQLRRHLYSAPHVVDRVDHSHTHEDSWSWTINIQSNDVDTTDTPVETETPTTRSGMDDEDQNDNHEEDDPDEDEGSDDKSDETTASTESVEYVLQHPAQNPRMQRIQNMPNIRTHGVQPLSNTFIHMQQQQQLQMQRQRFTQLQPQPIHAHLRQEPLDSVLVESNEQTQNQRLTSPHRYDQSLSHNRGYSNTLQSRDSQSMGETQIEMEMESATNKLFAVSAFAERYGINNIDAVDGIKKNESEPVRPSTKKFKSKKKSKRRNNLVVNINGHDNNQNQNPNQNIAMFNNNNNQNMRQFSQYAYRLGAKMHPQTPQRQATQHPQFAQQSQQSQQQIWQAQALQARQYNANGGAQDHEQSHDLRGHFQAMSHMTLRTIGTLDRSIYDDDDMRSTSGFDFKPSTATDNENENGNGGNGNGNGSGNGNGGHVQRASSHRAKAVTYGYQLSQMSAYTGVQSVLSDNDEIETVGDPDYADMPPDKRHSMLNSELENFENQMSMSVINEAVDYEMDAIAQLKRNSSWLQKGKSMRTINEQNTDDVNGLNGNENKNNGNNSSTGNADDGNNNEMKKANGHMNVNFGSKLNKPGAASPLTESGASASIETTDESDEDETTNDNNDIYEINGMNALIGITGNNASGDFGRYMEYHLGRHDDIDPELQSHGSDQ